MNRPTVTWETKATAPVETGKAQVAANEGETTVTAPVPFGIKTFSTNVVESLGNPFSQAAGHPFSTTTVLVLNPSPIAPQGGGSELVGPANDGAKEIHAELPAGFSGNPQNIPQCPLAVFEGGVPCPANTAVGYTNTLVAGGRIEKGEVTAKGLFSYASTAVTNSLVWNLEPAYGHPAAFGFKALLHFDLEADVRSGGDFGVNVGDGAVGEKPVATTITICAYGAEGVPPVFQCKPQPASGAKPFLRNITQCSEPAGTAPLWTVRADSWREPNHYVTATANTAPVTGCNLLQFNPEIEFTPSPPSEGGTNQADEPTGMTVNLKVPQPNGPEPGTPDVRDVVTQLPLGMTVSPAGGHGLQACSPAEFWPSVAREQEESEGKAPQNNEVAEHREPAVEAKCPYNPDTKQRPAEIGTVEVVTPLLKNHLQGQLFLAEPECGTATYPEPCNEAYAEGKGGPSGKGRLYGLYLQIDDPEEGIVIKLRGYNDVNPATGQITSYFEHQPQQPFELLNLKLKGGADAPLANSQTCGPAKTTATLTPWSAKENPETSEIKEITSSFEVEGCPSTTPFSPSFNAGTVGPNAVAADASPDFSLKLGREDREQDMSVVQVHMPLGLTGKIAGIPRCGDAQANAGTCGPESLIGTAEAAAGSGPDPYWVTTGRVYLTGPTTLKNGLHGPFGLSVVTPAEAGPFHLGNVVVRSVINIDPHTAAVTVTSDPIPQYVDGVQLRVRRINVNVNRQGSC